MDTVTCKTEPSVPPDEGSVFHLHFSPMQLFFFLRLSYHFDKLLGTSIIFWAQFLGQDVWEYRKHLKEKPVLLCHLTAAGGQRDSTCTHGEAHWFPDPFLLSLVTGFLLELHSAGGTVCVSSQLLHCKVQQLSWNSCDESGCCFR